MSTASTMTITSKAACGLALAAVAIAGSLGVSAASAHAAPAAAAPATENQEPECSNPTDEAKISQQQAEEAALAANPGTSLAGQSEVMPWDEESGPAVVWEVLLTDPQGQEVAVAVNADDASVIESEAVTCPEDSQTESLDVPQEVIDEDTAAQASPEDPSASVEE